MSRTQPPAVSPRVTSGTALLWLAAWIRRQAWLRVIYRLFPTSIRDKANVLMSAQARRRFPRTPAWDRPIPDAVGAPLPSPAAAPVSTSGGVNILGYIRGQFGLAESARMYARALIGDGVPVSLYDIDLGLPHGWDDRSLDSYISTALPHDVSIIFVNPDYLDRALDLVGRERLQGRYLIACWFWELEQIPASWIPAIAQVDEIMVASGFVEDAFRRIADRPILRVPLPLSPVADSGLQRADFGLDEGAFIFLCTFDFNSWIARKNPFAVITAFRQAFGPERTDVRLLVKSSNGHRHPAGMHALLAAAGGDARIIIRDEVIARAHVNALQRCCDAYVSLHRAEGFGLGLAECMAMGKPVIATGWSGNLEFMTEDNACLVDYTLVPVAEGEYLDAEGASWAEADIASTASAMRRLADCPAEAARIGARGQADVLARLSPTLAATSIQNRLAAIRGSAASASKHASQSGFPCP